MAVSPIQPPDLETVDLRAFRSSDIRPLLEEQAALWNGRYRWDFDSSKEVILRFVESRSLYGHVLLSGGRIIGYSYFVHESSKALVGDLFITRHRRAEQAERFLFHHTLQSAATMPGVRRIEGQLLGLSFNPFREAVFSRPLTVFERLFMITSDLSRAARPAEEPSPVRYGAWTERDLDATAELIRLAYDRHVDSLINDQYRNAAGARRFLYNSTQHPGCGVFFAPAALTALEPKARMLCGICLGSLVQSNVGHITQLCVAPFARGKGIGRQLLGRALKAFHQHGCEAVSLTVTGSNDTAKALYESSGFRVLQRFPAFVWENS